MIKDFWVLLKEIISYFNFNFAIWKFPKESINIKALQQFNNSTKIN